MNIGLYISASQNASYPDAIEQVCLADKLGFNSVWLTEKHFDQGNSFWSSPLIAASYMAAKTQRIKFGFAACISTLHHPVRLAEDFANLDVLSGGRLIIGLTRTSLTDYYHEVFQSPVKKSWKKFNEQFSIMCKLWRGEFHEKHSGTFYKIPKVKLYPSLIQKPLPPVYLIAGNDDSIIDAAQKGTGILLHAFQTTDNIKAKKKLYEDHFVDKLGLGPNILLSRLAYVGTGNKQANADIQTPLMQFFSEQMPRMISFLEKEYGTTVDFNFIDNNLAIFGDPASCFNKLSEISKDTGIQNFILLMNLTTLNHQKTLESMKLFAEYAINRGNF